MPSPRPPTSSPRPVQRRVAGLAWDAVAAGTRGFYRAAVRHGVSTVRCGERYPPGVIFHDAA